MDQPPSMPQPPQKPNVKREVLDQTITLILGGLSLVAALAWNDAVQSTFKEIFPQGGGLLYKFIYAALITTIIVVISMRLRVLKPKS